MKLTINPTILFRVPKFSYQDNIENNWEELKMSISVSSTQFHEKIKKTTVNELDSLPSKVKFTLWKYFNRSRFRATPYGTFAGYGIFNFKTSQDMRPIIIQNEQTSREFIDWPEKSNINISLDELIKQNGKIVKNGTQYFISGSLRYLAKSDVSFELCEHTPDPVSEMILQYCNDGIKINTLTQKLLAHGISYDQSHEKIEELVDLQILFTELHPNIIGTDYFQRLNILKTSDLPKYTISERTHIKGALPPVALQHLPGLIKKLQAFAPAQKSESLEGFIQRFTKKFEQREIPLMLALDPEIGVGYGSLESVTAVDDFVKQFNGRESGNQQHNLFKDYLKDEFFNKDMPAKHPIMLDDILSPQDIEPDPLPNSLSAIVTISDELTCIESLGGCTANSLLGRFTLGDEHLSQHCRTIAQEEEKANPEVVFFDLAYMEESYVDNINRRNQIYDAQLSILSYDTSTHPITLSDIMVSVTGNKLMLRSKSLNKRLIPRMCSAYNYSRSELSVFRLLCDLQYQSISVLPAFKPENMFPELKYYPRVQYKNILLSTCKWRVSGITEDAGRNLTVEKCRSFLQSLQVTRYFKAGIADQTLCFDLNNDDDMEALIQLINKDQNLLLTEVIVPEHHTVTDISGKPYFAEFIVTISHHETIYYGISKNEGLPAMQIRSIYPPGSSWLYFEIYCHPVRANFILQEYIKPYIKAHDQDIRHWFFIRYSENGEHLRLRIKMNDESKSYLLTSDLSHLLFTDLQSGIITDLLIKTYKREVERYHPEHIDAVELHFRKDSDFVLSLIHDLPGDMQCYQLCHKIVEAVMATELFQPDKFINGIRGISDYFNTEHKLKTENFKNLNTRYKQYLQTDPCQLSEEQERHFTILLKSFTSVLQGCEPKIRIQMFRDMMHMHVNRLFNDHQRTHEMILYYFISKDLKRRAIFQSALEDIR